MNIGILLAAGRSTRFGKDKLFETIQGKPVLRHSLEILESSPLVDSIYIAANTGNIKKIERLVDEWQCAKVRAVYLGGRSRYASVAKAAQFLRAPAKKDILVIHNAANPYATAGELDRCITMLTRSHRGLKGVAVAHPVTATVKRVIKAGALIDASMIETTLDRRELRMAETPQAVNARAFLEAVQKAPPSKNDFTDDLAVLESRGFKTALTAADAKNKKITTQDDLPHKVFPRGGHMIFGMMNDKNHVPSPYVRVGLGEDSHAFSHSRTALVLGGVRIRGFKALQAESDGDVLLHALCNAISSALGEGSLGTYATKMNERGVTDSKKYLAYMLERAAVAGLCVEQCAFSIEALRPSIDKFAPLLKKSLSKLLGISPECIGITATSGEGLTPFGKGEAIKCSAIVLLTQVR